MPRMTVLLVSLFAATVAQAGVQTSDGSVIKGDLPSANVTFSQVGVNPASGHSYEFVRLSTAISWHDAVIMAENAGGYLATVTDSVKARIVTTLLSGPGDEAWLGASDEAQEGAWTWITGEPWGYTNWYPGEPNAGRDTEDYLLATSGLGGRWVDVWDNNYGLIIEHDTATRNIIFNPLNGHSYEYVKLPGDVFWHDAVIMAQNAGGYLATITDSTEAAIVTTFLSIPGNNATWLGGSDEAQEGVWAWVTGEAWDYTNWYPGEPNAAYPNQDYLEAQHVLGGRWVDVEDGCDGIIIEKDSTSPNVIINPANGHKYEFVRLETAISWHEAVTMAENAGGYLTTVTDSIEARIVTTLLSNSGSEAWLGASDEAQEGTWTWITGEPWGYTNWYPGEPNAGRDTEDYLLATNGLGGRWVDVWDNNYGLIIETGGSFVHGPAIVSVSPAQHELDVSVGSPIQVVFDTDMDSTTINRSTFLVSGHLFGRYSGVVEFDVATRTATFQADRSFAVGERVTVVLTDAIQSADGTPLPVGQIWMFTMSSSCEGETALVVTGTVAVGSRPNSVVLADFDNDGDLDMATVNRGSGDVSVSLNLGHANYAPEVRYPTGPIPHHLTVADVDNDGAMDLVTGNCGEPEVSILWGDGLGGFNERSNLSVGDCTEPVCAADFDGDGDLDIAASISYGNHIGVFENLGSRNFASPVLFYVGHRTIFNYTADVNNDFILDLLSANRDDNTVSTVLGSGNLSFGSPVAYAAGNGTHAVTTTDLNGDSYVDLVAVSQWSDDFSVLLNTGSGTFSSSVSYPTGPAPHRVCAGDINGDGFADLFTGNYEGSTITMRLGNGDGTLGPNLEVTTGSNPVEVAMGDLDGDGDLDLAVANMGGNNVAIVLSTCADESQAPSQPTLRYPTDAQSVLYEMLPAFSWTQAVDPNPGDTVHYKLELSIDPDFSFVKTIDDITDTEYQLTDSLDFGTHYWWRVIATDPSGNFSVSDTADFWTWTLGDVNHSHTVTLGDVMVLVDYMFISHTPIEPPMAGDMNGDCKITLGDIMWLVADLFISRVELRVGCE